MHKYKFHNFLILYFFIVINTINGQSNANNYTTNIQYFSTTDGLSHRDVRCIFQDKDGMTWIGTPNGLNRFDGYTFEHWLDKNHGVDLRDLEDIGQDDEGWLWLATRRGIVFFHPITEVFQTAEERFGTDNPLIRPKRYFSSFDFPVDAKGRIYINSDVSDTMYRYHSLEGFTILKLPVKIHTTHVGVRQKDETLYYRINSSTTKQSYTKYTFVIDKIEGKTIHYKIDEKPYTGSKKTSRLWKQTSGRSFEIYTENGAFLVGLDETDIKYDARNTSLDKQGRLWIGTDFGFYMVSIKKNSFEFITLPFDNIQNKKSSARGLFVNESGILACLELDLGLANYDFISQKWTSLKRISAAKAIYPLKDDSYYIGAQSKLIHWKNSQNSETYLFERSQETGQGFSTLCFSPSLTNDNLLWIGAHPGLLKLNLATASTHQLVSSEVMSKQSLQIQYIVPDAEHQNHLWLCTTEGLWLFDETTETVLEEYNWNQTEKSYLPTDNVNHLYQENETILWIATNNGIIRWNKKSKEFRQITIEDGLPNNVIYAVYPDDFGNLWMSSDYGIIKMNKVTFAIENFLPKDGIGQIEFNRASHFEYRNKQGQQRLFFGGLDGITDFYPKDFQQNEKLLQPQLTLLTYKQFSGSKQISIDKTVIIKETNRIVIPPNDYISELEVGLLTYDDANNNQYLYQLNDGDWQVQKKQNIQLGQLPYGSHQLHIKAKTINNTPSENVLEYTIVVKRPFYLTWWFIVLSLVTIVGLGFYFYKRRTQQFKERQAELEKLVKERTAKVEKQAEELKKLDVLKSRFFANVSHELRTPLTLILGPINTILKRGDLTNRDYTMLSKAKQGGKSLLKLVSSILDLSKMEASKMDLEELPTMLFPFVRRIVSAFESHAERKGLHLNFEYQADENLQLELDKKKLEIVLNNLLSNAIKFTSKEGKVTVFIKDEKNKINITVKDTGRGIHQEDLPNVFNRFYQSTQKDAKTEGGTGIGLALSKESVELMNGEMWVESQLNIGSQFHISLPRKEVLGTAETPIIEEKSIEKTAEPILIRTKSDKQLLIVEDNYSLRDYIKTILEPYYDIITASNGKEALEILTNVIPSSEASVHRQGTAVRQAKRPSLILSDIMMPQMDGYELLNILKSTDYFRNIPVVMLTARADMQDKLKALRIGVDDYMLKPFDEEELLTRIANLLVNYDARQAFLQTENKESEIIVSEVLISDDDQKWLEDLEKLIIKEMNNSIFSNDYLAELLHTSKKSMSRKIKKFTGLTPNKYIRTIRLQQAKTLLEHGMSVKKTAYEVGFLKVGYFSKLFKEEFGKLPSEYR